MTIQPTLFGATATPAPRAADAGPRYTPVELARLLRLPAPTREQAAIIAAPVEPLLVVAGAGSGKTETMASRVVWLVANGYAHPDQILGLTFTRKAAGEGPEAGWATALVRRTADTMAASTFAAVANSKCRVCPVRTSCPVSGQGRQVVEPPTTRRPETS